jgi:hypothetical protein
VKLAILGESIWLQRYHTGLEVRKMPEYMFTQNHNDYGLYTFFDQYFTKRWENPGISEYDLETDELVYRGSNTNEMRREPFPKMPRDLTGSPQVWLEVMPWAYPGTLST